MSADAVGIGPLRYGAADFTCLVDILCCAKHPIPRLIQRSSVSPAVGNCHCSWKPKPPCLNRTHDVVESVEPPTKSLRSFECVKVTFYPGHSNPGSAK